ncbi:MAG: RAMP superfamily CRISPR-associated protein [Desulfobacca sp.]|nr:RAMP superfamily CRISPR-associated protein [Desulfobacca sp.]
MLKRLVNECRFTLTITTQGPFIIREGRLKKPETQEEKEKKVKGDPDSIPIRRVWYDDRRDFQRDQPYYLPGTSLRGVMRSHLERIVRSAVPDRLLCCDPLQQKAAPDQGCSSWLDNHKGQGTGYAYKHSCVVCRLFGSTAQASRIRIADSPTVTVPAEKMSYRDHIGIDRFTGGVCSGANFRDLVIEAGVSFQNEIMIRNFELWQLGLLAYVIRDLYCWEDGRIRMGYGKSKGYGQVQGEVGEVSISYYGPSVSGGSMRLKDLGDVLSADEQALYDLKPGGSPATDLLVDPNPELYRTTWKVWDNQAFWGAAAQAWNDHRSGFNSLDELRDNRAVDSPPEKARANGEKQP